MLIPKEATGLKIVELENWPGKCFILPRTEIKEIKDRSEAYNPAIYFLFGEEDESTNQKLYIGESEEFLKRLLSHDDTKDFWNTAIVFTGSLDKAKIKYLEYLSTKEARLANRYDLENSSLPSENSLNEFDLVSIKEYFERIKYILSALGYPVFNAVQKSLTDSKLYYLKADGVDATAQILEDGSLNVLKGSLARIKETVAFWGWSQSARKRFVAEGVLKDNGDGVSYVYTKDVLYKSPSAAAATTTGRPINGWTAWKDDKGNTLDENLRK